MDTPDGIDAWIGLDIGDAEHFVDMRDGAGAPLFASTVTGDESAIEALLDRAAGCGTPALGDLRRSPITTPEALTEKMGTYPPPPPGGG